jgi:hypothetical protein
VTAGNATYDGIVHGATATVTGAGTVTVTATLSYSGRLTTTYGPSTAAPMNAGDYTATGTTTGDANHTGSTGTADYSIARKTATIAAVSTGKNFGTPDPALAATQTGFLVADGITVSATRAPGEAVGTYLITPAASDGGTGKLANYAVTANTAVFTISNVAPIVGPVYAPVAPVSISPALTVTASFSDPSSPTSHTVSWNWGDGATSAGTTTETGGSGTASGSHTYANPGIYTISVTVTDSGSLSGSATADHYVVIYDPNGGFVTGGGWINSPVGAYVPSPSLTGKATFGFVSKYQKGANAPSGNTEFQFQAAGLNFHATLFDWLTIAGARAQYKGSGTINGAGNFSFMLTAIDGDVSGGNGVDKFRIKIWDNNNGGVTVYDNNIGSTAGTADTADPVTGIASGSIVIHK